MKSKEKLIMLRGIPGSGKSTWASEYIATHNNTIRVNKDSLRTMLHFDKWNGRNESVTSMIEYGLIRTALENGMNVIVDNTNLTQRHEDGYKLLADEIGAEFVVHELDTPYSVCVERDAVREKKVGKSVILKFAMMTGKYPAPAKGFVVCDIDGTIADIEHRRHYVTGEKKDWKGFFSEMHKDTVRENVHDMLKNYHELGYEILFVSARPETYREVTEAWLDLMVDVPYVGVLMRPANDKGADTDTKYKIYKEMLAKYNVLLVIDDRPSVIRMWEGCGLTVIDVGNQVEF